MCCSGLVSQVSSQPMLVLSARLAQVKAVSSACCIGASFVRRCFDPLSYRDTGPQQKYAEWIHVSSSPYTQPMALSLFMIIIAAVIY